MPHEVVNKFYEKIPSATTDMEGYYTFNCAANKTLPELHISFGESFHTTITGDIMSFAPNETNHQRKCDAADSAYLEVIKALI